MTAPETPSPAPPPSGRGGEGESFWSWTLYTVYCIEAGLVLVLVPWTQYWDGNALFRLWPGLAAAGLSGAARGAVTALGAYLLALGIHSLASRMAGLRGKGGVAS
jgi:hypothetical protein